MVVSLASIHYVFCRVNNGKQSRCHAHLISTYRTTLQVQVSLMLHVDGTILELTTYMFSP